MPHDAKDRKIIIHSNVDAILTTLIQLLRVRGRISTLFAARIISTLSYSYETFRTDRRDVRFQPTPSAPPHRRTRRSIVDVPRILHSNTLTHHPASQMVTPQILPPLQNQAYSRSTAHRLFHDVLTRGSGCPYSILPKISSASSLPACMNGGQANMIQAFLEHGIFTDIKELQESKALKLSVLCRLLNPISRTNLVWQEELGRLGIYESAKQVIDVFNNPSQLNLAAWDSDKNSPIEDPPITNPPITDEHIVYHIEQLIRAEVQKYLEDPCGT